MDKENMDCTPSSRSTRTLRVFNQIPLSSTMLQKSLPLRISTTAETTDSGLASTNCTQVLSSSENSCRIMENYHERAINDEANHRQHSEESSASRNIQTPRSGFMLLRRNLNSRGSSTPKRCASNCPFPTPDRLNEPFITHEVFESQLLALQDKNSFSPCIDWQSTMNPTVFDTTNPAAYLPPVRSQSAEQRYERAINAFFQRQIVPSPTPTTARRRVAACLVESHNSTIELKSPVSSVSRQLRSMTTQTEVTIPPNYDIAQVFAPFATFTGNETQVSMMETSRSSQGSPTSASSLSRRKLFSEEDLEDYNDTNENNCESAENQKYHSFDETVALSSPPEHCRMGSAAENSFDVVKKEEFGEDSFSCESYRVADIEEIPREALDIDLSPIRPQSIADGDQMEIRHTASSPNGVFHHGDHAAENSVSTIDMSIV